MQRNFAELFVKQSKEYALFRPTYPRQLYNQIFDFCSIHSPSLFAFISFLFSLLPVPFSSSSSISILFLPPNSTKGKALDLGCGSGQATKELAKHFDQVTGIDPSEEQLQEARGKEQELPKGLTFLQGSAHPLPAEAAPASSVDLVTCAQAFHWFSFPAAFTEITRVLKPSGVCAIWTYRNPSLSNAVADRWVNGWFYEELMGPYWSSRRGIIDRGYKDVEEEMVHHFGVVEAVRETLEIRKKVSISDFINYLSSWSAYQSWKEKNPGAEDPLDCLKRELCKAYEAANPESQIEVSHPLVLLLGAFPKQPS